MMACKPPKLRAKLGEFYRDKEGKLYCVVRAFRLKKNPHVWIYTLEERKDLSNPVTPLSIMCEAVVGRKLESLYIVWDPCDEAEAIRLHHDDYIHGDRQCVDNKRLLNEFKLVSSGIVDDSHGNAPVGQLG